MSLAGKRSLLAPGINHRAILLLLSPGFGGLAHSVLARNTVSNFKYILPRLRVLTWSLFFFFFAILQEVSVRFLNGIMERVHSAHKTRVRNPGLVYRNIF